EPVHELAVLPIVAKPQTAGEPRGVRRAVRHRAPLEADVAAEIETLPVVERRTRGSHRPIVKISRTRCVRCPDGRKGRNGEKFFHSDLRIPVGRRWSRTAVTKTSFVLRRNVAKFTLSVSESVSMTAA